jgi:glycosyltransferase involved in cell wall biosynthesis
MSSQLKIGIIARVDSGGLANMTFDWWKNMPEITKCLTILSDSPHQEVTRYPEQIICQNYPTIEQIDLFLKDIDVVIGFETPYNWNVFSMANERGIKTVLIPMYEWTEENPPIQPDLYLCPSLMERDIYKYYPTKSEYIQNPIDRKLFKFKQREKAHTFVFNNGHGGVYGRNGIVTLLQAIKLVKSDVKFLIHSQVQIPEINDPRVELRLGDVRKRTDLFEEGDVLLFPRMFGALSLPTWEALSCGMPVLSTNIYPFNQTLPKEWFFEADGSKKVQTSAPNRIIDMYYVNPQKLADKIDEWANRDITEDSKKAGEIAEQFSWITSKDKIIKVLQDLCDQIIILTI